MIYFRIQDVGSGRILAENMQEFSRVSEFEGNKQFIQKVNRKDMNGTGLRGAFEIMGDISIWLVVENESDLLKSSKLFDKTFEIYKVVAVDMSKHQKKQISAYAHILNTIQVQIRQKIEDFSDDTKFFGKTYEESLDNICQLIGSDKRAAADLICYAHKRIADMRAHLLGTGVIYFGEQYEIKLATVSLKRAILNQCASFLEDFDEKIVEIRFFFEDDCMVHVDKNMGIANSR